MARRFNQVLLPLFATWSFAVPTTIADEVMTKIVANDAAPGDRFGHAVAIDADRMVLGADHADGRTIDAGIAYLFNAASGIQLARITPTTGSPGAHFGTAVAIGGGVVAVGAPSEQVNGIATGVVHVFRADDGAPIGRLLAPDGSAGDAFGTSLAIDGGMIAVGAPRRDDDGLDSGAVLIFDAASLIHRETIRPDDGGFLKLFGMAVDLDDGRLLVGAQGNSENGLLAGAAYLFDVESSLQLHKLLAQDGASNDFFGSAVALDGDLAAVGAWSKSVVFDHSGAVYLFDAARGVQTERLVPADAGDRDHFGRSLALDGQRLAVGAPGNDDGVFESGSVYIYDLVTGRPSTELIAPDRSAGDAFGVSVAIDGTWMVIGADGVDGAGSASGSVYVLDLDGGNDPPCPADIAQNDDRIDAADLGLLLSGWGDAGPGADLAHPFNRVDAADIGVLLGSWGACP
jgi:hypothetical protein